MPSATGDACIMCNRRAGVVQRSCGAARIQRNRRLYLLPMSFATAMTVVQPSQAQACSTITNSSECSPDRCSWTGSTCTTACSTFNGSSACPSDRCNWVGSVCTTAPNTPAVGGTCADPDPAADGVADYVCPSGYYTISPADSRKECTDVDTCNANCCKEVTECLKGREPNNELQRCVPCALGKVAMEGYNKCTACPPGRLAAATADFCIDCAAGTVISVDNKTCEPCSPGTHNVAGNAECSPCPAGSVPSALQHACVECAEGKYSLAGSAECSFCEEGTVPILGGTGCADCGTGKFAEVGQIACTPCAPSQFAPAGSHRCSNCDYGHRSNADGSGCVKDTDTVTDADLSMGLRLNKILGFMLSLCLAYALNLTSA